MQIVGKIAFPPTGGELGGDPQKQNELTYVDSTSEHSTNYKIRNRLD